MNKIEVARRQLGTALWLFLRDADPVSVQILACGAGEILDALLVHKGGEPLSAHMMRTTGNTLKELRALRNVYWNAFKHASAIDGRIRDDEKTLGNFSDDLNDAHLMIAWSDYHRLSGALPVAAQVLLTWYFAINEEKLAQNVDVLPYRKAFPGIQALSRDQQKKFLRFRVSEWESNEILLANPETEQEFLVGWAVRTEG